MYEAGGKRLIDLLGATALLIFLSPLLAAAALVLLLCEGRPVLFRQWRLGRHARPFLMLKLRTMRPGAGPDADRLHPLGRIFRAGAIDELPQLLHVLRGDMSLVGPRPLPLAYLPRFTPRQLQRFRVRPGLCGLAQAAGRNAVPWSRRLALDVRYARRPRFSADLRILWRCGGVLLRAEGVAAPGHVTGPVLPVQRKFDPEDSEFHIESSTKSANTCSGELSRSAMILAEHRDRIA